MSNASCVCATHKGHSTYYEGHVVHVVHDHMVVYCNRRLQKLRLLGLMWDDGIALCGSNLLEVLVTGGCR